MSSKITIIGAGSVGATIAYTLSNEDIASNIVLIDINKQKVEGEVMDIAQGTCFRDPISIVAGEYEDAKGSDIVIITPSTNDMITMNTIFLLFVIHAPTFSPIGVIDISAPNVKNIIPAITITVPTRKQRSTLGVTGAIVNPKIRTIATIGSTALSASINFSRSFAFKTFNNSPLSIYIQFTFTINIP